MEPYAAFGAGVGGGGAAMQGNELYAGARYSRVQASQSGAQAYIAPTGAQLYSLAGAQLYAVAGADGDEPVYVLSGARGAASAASAAPDVLYAAPEEVLYCAAGATAAYGVPARGCAEPLYDPATLMFMGGDNAAAYEEPGHAYSFFAKAVGDDELA
jgi:hypothetical protein